MSRGAWKRKRAGGPVVKVLPKLAPPPPVYPRSGMRRCLGPCPEHQFWSSDKTYDCVCERGREKMRLIPPILAHAVHLPDH